MRKNVANTCHFLFAGVSCETDTYFVRTYNPEGILMRNLLKRVLSMNTRTEPKAEHLPDDYGWLQKQYIHFCQSKFAGKQNPNDLIIDLQRLMAIPEITHLTFAENNKGLEIVVATTPVLLVDPATSHTHFIGRFIIRINRKAQYYNFHNIDGGLMSPINGIPQTIFHHPHINSDGTMCVTQGREELSEYLSEGKMYDAIRMIIRMLHTIDEYPFAGAKISLWPKEEP